TKRVGRQYVLERRDLTRADITKRLHHLCESVGSRLRAQHKLARGIYVYAKTIDRHYWHATQMYQLPFYSDMTINTLAQQLFLEAPANLQEIGIHCYELSDDTDAQLSLFGDMVVRQQQLVGAVDTINQRYGERTVHSADTLDTGSFVK
ncbi:MAG TPA: hypothetical protein VFS65_01005, partial [Candidatus Saccharimonadales bacterium]|nr:hypothetical protein [Candidatus Saccharimonadales bacterium]